jgi:hypothetical protein
LGFFPRALLERRCRRGVFISYSRRRLPDFEWREGPCMLQGSN